VQFGVNRRKRSETIELGDLRQRVHQITILVTCEAVSLFLVRQMTTLVF